MVVLLVVIVVGISLTSYFYHLHLLEVRRWVECKMIFSLTLIFFLIFLLNVFLILLLLFFSIQPFDYSPHLPPQLSIFNRIKFYEEDRLLEVYDPQWKPVIAMHMGTNLPTFSIPEDCTDYLHYLQEKNYTLPHHGLDDDEYE